MDSELLQQNLKCPICLTAADEPFETSCCGHIFCSSCIQGITNSKCPICRCERFTFRENKFVKNLLNSIIVKCPFGCEKSIKVSNTKIHRYQCNESIFKCSLKYCDLKCNFQGSKKESVIHFSEKHTDQMIVLAEHYASLKSIYDKHSLFDKLIKIQKLENTKENSVKKERNLSELSALEIKNIDIDQIRLDDL
jgi:hypothetical protein